MATEIHQQAQRLGHSRRRLRPLIPPGAATPPTLPHIPETSGEHITLHSKLQLLQIPVVQHAIFAGPGAGCLPQAKSKVTQDYDDRIMASANTSGGFREGMNHS
jgi:hypothetical protein